MSVSEYEKKFSELVRLVPYIQADKVLKCKRFLSGLQHRIIVHLSVVPQIYLYIDIKISIYLYRYIDISIYIDIYIDI